MSSFYDLVYLPKVVICLCLLLRNVNFVVVPLTVLTCRLQSYRAQVILKRFPCYMNRLWSKVQSFINLCRRWPACHQERERGGSERRGHGERFPGRAHVEQKVELPSRLPRQPDRSRPSVEIKTLTVVEKRVTRSERLEEALFSPGLIISALLCQVGDALYGFKHNVCVWCVLQSLRCTGTIT